MNNQRFTNITVFVTLLSLCTRVRFINGAKQVVVKINDLDTLESSLREQGVSSPAIDAIYSAASCNLKMNKEISSKLSALISPVERIHSNMNSMFNQLVSRSNDPISPRGTLEIMISHGVEGKLEATEGSGSIEIATTAGLRPQGLIHNDAEYYAATSGYTEVDPEKCKSVEAARGLVASAKDRKSELLRIAKRIYGYDGEGVISQLARFYYMYTKDHYDERSSVMGLAKLLGDFASTTSEIYFMTEMVGKYENPCGSVPKRLRRNVQTSRIEAGVCMRNYGKWEDSMKNIEFFKHLPQANALSQSQVLTQLGSCQDQLHSIEGIIERGNVRVALLVEYSSGTNACGRFIICGPGTALTGPNACGIKSKSVEFTNIENIDLSVVTGRFRLNDMPEEFNSFENKYCSIQGVQTSTIDGCTKPIRTKQRFTVFALERKWFVTDRNVLVAHGQDTNNICFYNCDNGCHSGCTRCKGDESYESVFGKWNSNCTCNYCHNCSDIYIQMNELKFGVDAVAHVNWDVAMPIESEKEVVCNSCKAMCKGFTIRIERDVSFDIIHVCIARNCKNINNTLSDFSYNIPEDFLHSTEFTVMFFRSDGKGKNEVTISCQDSHICSSLTCDVCLIRFANPHCYKFVNWIILIAGFSGLVFIIPLVFIIYKILRVVLALVLVPSIIIIKIIGQIVRVCLRLSRKKMAGARARMDELIDEEERPARRDAVFPLRGVQLAIIMILLTCGSCCEVTLSMDSKVLDCAASITGQMKCKVNTVIDVPLSALGEESCINLRDQSGVLVHLIKIRTNSIEQKCSKNLLYYTSEPNFRLKNVFRCRNAGECQDDRCEKIKLDDEVPIPSADVSRAGLSGCRRVTGFWGKGCFYASQACQFYRIELQNPKKESYEVFDCKEWFWQVTVNITSSDRIGEAVEQRTLESSLPTKTSLGLMQLQTITSPIVIDVDKCFIKRIGPNTKTGMAKCAQRSKPQIGLVGGIQCATPSLAESGSKSCIVNPDETQIIVQDDTLVFISRFANVTEVWKDGLLPKPISSSIISEDSNGQVSIHYTGNTDYNIRLKLDNYKISYQSEKTKCEAHFRSLEGCSKCGPGARLIVEITLSSSPEAAVSVKCPSGTISSSALVKSSNPKTIFKMNFEKSEVDETCEVECPGNTVSIAIKGKLLRSITIYRRNSTNIFSKTAEFFESLPWANFGVLRYLYVVIGVLFSVPIIYLAYLGFIRLLIYIFKGCLKCCKRKPGKQHNV